MPEAHIEIAADDGCLDAFVACPDGQGARPAIVLLSGRAGLTPPLEARARGLASQGYYVLAPAWVGGRADSRREDAEAWLDHLADERLADDTRVGVLGFGAGADLAIRLAAWKSERIAAAAAFRGRGFGRDVARELAQRINGVLHIGYAAGSPPRRAGLLEAALCAAGVDFDTEIYADEPSWPGILDLFARTLVAARKPASGTEISPERFNREAHL